MKNITLILVLLSFFKTTFSQEYFPEKPIRFYLGFETNTLSTEKTYSNSLVNADYNVKSVFLNGYGLNSDVEFSISDNLIIGTGLNLNVYLHKYKFNMKYLNSEFKDEVFIDYHPTIEIPVNLKYLLNINPKNKLGFQLGFSYYSYIYEQQSAAYNTEFDSLSVHFLSSPDELLGARNNFKCFNISANLGISYYKKLKNHEYIRVSLSYKRYFISNPVTLVRLYKGDEIVAYDEFKSYIHGLSLTFAYSFSQKNNFEEVYKKGIKKGRSL